MPWESVRQWLIDLRVFIERHLLTIIAVSAAIFLVAMVPQLANVWTQFPVSEWLNAGYVAVLLFLTAVYAAALRWMTADAPAPTAAASSVAARAGRMIRRLCMDWPNSLAAKYSFAAACVAFAAAAITFAFGASPHSNRLHTLSGATCRQFAVMSFWFALWAAWRWIRGEAVTSVHRCFGRLLGWVFFGWLVGELLWFAANFSESLGHVVSFRHYAIWAILHILALTVGIARLVDHWSSVVKWPVRTPAVLITIIYLLRVQGPTEIEPLPAPPVPPSAVGADNPRGSAPPDWLDHFTARLEHSGKTPGPFVFVAASGGGSRAAIFTSLVYDVLAREKMTLVDLRPPEELPADSGERGTWADHIVLVSSVSGGSLATANFLNGGCRPSGSAAAHELRSVSWDDLRESMSRDARRAAAVPYCPRASADRDAETDAAEHAAWVNRMRKLADDIDAGNGPLADFRHSAFDEMCTDFMAPALRGTVTVGFARGRSLARFWEQRFGWAPADSASGFTNPGRSGFDPASQPPALINACRVDTGSRLIIGFPPVPDEWMATVAEPNRSHSEIRPYSMSLFVPPDRGIRLGDAVMMSANFPFGFPASEIRVDAPPGSLHVLDGGVIDNTGIDSIVYLLRALGASADNRDNRALEALETLRKRGVVLVVIDSGAKPDPRIAEGTLSYLREPLGALDNASYAGADIIGGRIDRELGDLLSRHHQGSGRTDRLVERFRFLCNHSQTGSTVMTAWSLGPSDKATVVVRFLAELDRFRERSDADGNRDPAGKTDLEKKFELLRSAGFASEFLQRIASASLQLTKIEGKLREAEISLLRSRIGIPAARPALAAELATQRTELGKVKVCLDAAAQRLAGVSVADSEKADWTKQLAKLSEARNSLVVYAERLASGDVGSAPRLHLEAMGGATDGSKADDPVQIRLEKLDAERSRKSAAVRKAFEAPRN